jgi:hypothetical protein
MNKLFSMLIFMFIISSCTNNGAITTDAINNPNSASGITDSTQMPAIKFENDLFDFGNITQGEKVRHSFVFTNTGKTDLIISSAQGSCGCTVPQWPKKPITPGEKGEIEVVFDSEGKKNNIHKKVTIVANTQPATTVIAIKGFIIAPEEENQTNNQ